MGKLRFLDYVFHADGIAKGTDLAVGAFFAVCRLAGVKAHINCYGNYIKVAGEKFSELREGKEKNERVLSSRNADSDAVSLLDHIVFFNGEPHSAQYFLNLFHVKAPCAAYTETEYAERNGFFMAKIYIDQGHNPSNPNAGAEGNGYREQDLVYEIGVETAALLRAAGQEVRLSRPTPETQLGSSNISSLAARVGEANAWGADLFVSLHANASDIESASGSEAYVFRRGGAAEALAESILENLAETTGLQNRGVFVRPTLYVLRRTAMPAALIELGFITNPADAALMADQPWLFARGVADGILEYLGVI